MAAGRPTKKTPELLTQICERISVTTRGLHEICKADDMPGLSTVMAWLKEDPKFQEQYARAKELQAEYMAEEILDIADDGSNDYMTITKGDMEYNVEDREVTSRSKLRVDTRKWLMSKLAPKKYGDRIEVDAPNGLIQVTIRE